jgi:hypothetical protein
MIMVIMVIMMNYAPKIGDAIYDARLQENHLRTEKALMLAKLGIKELSSTKVWKDHVHRSLIGRSMEDRHRWSFIPRTVFGLCLTVGATFWFFEVLGTPLPGLAAVPMLALLSGEVLILSSYMPQH